MLRIFERIILLMIYSLIISNGIGRMNYNNALQTLRSDLDIVHMIKNRSWWCLRHLFWMHEIYPCRTITVLNSEGSQHVGNLKFNGSDTIEGGGKKMGVRNWRRQKYERESGGGEFWNRLKFTKDCNSRSRKRRILVQWEEITVILINIK